MGGRHQAGITGRLRRNAQPWRHVNLDGVVITVGRSLEETNAGLRVKLPKSRYGRRRISLPAATVEALRAHRLRQGELRPALGLGRPGPDDLVFALADGSPLPPDRLSQQWRRVADSLKPVTFHALRHTHASALIAAGLDIVTISRRLGHGSPGITLGIYAHKFKNTDILRPRMQSTRPWEADRLGCQFGAKSTVLFSRHAC